MKLAAIKYWMSILILFFVSITNLLGQSTTNNCGVRAIMTPSNDSVITQYTLVNFQSNSINATSYHFLYDGFPNGVPNSSMNTDFQTGITQIGLVAENGSCRDTAICYYFYPGTFPTDSNNSKQYYGLAKAAQYLSDFIHVKTGGFFIAGDRNNNSYFNLPRMAQLFRTRENGCVLWSKNIELGYTSKINKILESPDGNFYLSCGFDEWSFLIIKVDDQGSIIWSKRVFDATGSQFYINNFSIADDGNLVLLGRFYSDPDYSANIVKMSSNGDILWARKIQEQGSQTANLREVIQKQNFLYCDGRADFWDNVNQFYYGYSFIIKQDYTTGQINWVKNYNSNSQGYISLADLHDEGDTILINCFAGNVSPGELEITSFLKIDTAGNVLKSGNITANITSPTDPFLTANSEIIPLSSGGYYILSHGTEILPLQPGYSNQTRIVLLDSDFAIKWSKVYYGYAKGFYFKGTTDNRHNLVLGGNEVGPGVNYYGSYGEKIMFKKVDEYGDTTLTNCHFGDISSRMADLVVTQTENNSMIDSSPACNSNNYLISLSDAYEEVRNVCPDYVDSCSFLALSGPSDICGLNDVYEYRIHKNKACGQPVQWQIPQGVNIISQTDSLLQVRFQSFGIYKVRVSLLAGCMPLSDSVIVVASSHTPPLNLGTDTSICPGNTIALHAGTYYLNYLWNDGSVDSFFLVRSPGQYWVNVSDSCGNTFSDTINVLPATYIPVSIGPDRSKCNSDTIRLNATAGFINYQWLPSYNISSVSMQNVVVNPLVDTSYTLIAEKSPGCFAYDTVRIIVNHSPIINLGIDTRICTGDSLLLDAGQGFVQYLWNTGQTSRIVYGHSVGLYFISATTSEGCISSDSIRILQLYALPAISLNKDSTLCFGETRVLDAGGGYFQYFWNDGSQNEFLHINSTGVYSVMVTDMNGCHNVDSVLIKTILPLPSHFLQSDTSICSYGSMELSPLRDYENYLWNTGSTQKIISITTPGLYWLEVRDTNHCFGSDSINVYPKECLKGFFIPTAFTPNGDGKNDIFQPNLFGNVIKYHFMIFNRWGQVVFSSTNINQGWDGTVNGQKQDSNVFVWVCQYQFAGENIKIERGTVNLIR